LIHNDFSIDIAHGFARPATLLQTCRTLLKSIAGLVNKVPIDCLWRSDMALWVGLVILKVRDGP
jgi:hypothetical protein